jgi:hypothetical protein
MIFCAFLKGYLLKSFGVSCQKRKYLIVKGYFEGLDRPNFSRYVSVTIHRCDHGEASPWFFSITWVFPMGGYFMGKFKDLMVMIEDTAERPVTLEEAEAILELVVHQKLTILEAVRATLEGDYVSVQNR